MFGLETVDGDGKPVVSTEETMMLRGERLAGEEVDAVAGEEPVSPSREPEIWEIVEVPVDRFAAHTYSECARIWNPIHTDSAHAAEHGLPFLLERLLRSCCRAQTHGPMAASC